MPRFFFDIQDDCLTTDDVGTEFPNAHAACDAAIRVLPNIARDEVARSESRQVAVLLRDEAGRALFAASLILNTKWLVDTA
ncbi:DUF6894 family protein [Methylobacterium nonmethylotrophicum]|uniref:DUF6894 domain-containing protein n=1 Tax=Methylobacterium nonmethylotrophicum TaxID=1141884 RepID=A0A4Z0NEI0_9HYPH|nr:hypothetical protein [Methylobacterium nonmethylotrophicum]TGD94077.1 hypothetical protein EU555_32685 [Methylobacterium nonmethylotrophicum]